MGRHDRVGGLIWTVLGILICIGSVKLRLGNFHKPGPGFMPFLSGVLLGLFGLILMFSTLLKRLEEEEEIKDRKIWVKGNWKNFLFSLSALFGYVLLLEPIGFILTTFLFLFFLIKIIEPKGWLMPLIISGATVTSSYLIFTLWLKLQFPKGIFIF